MPGAYIHLPFCSAKCDYCDFFSLVIPEALRARVLDVLQHEIARWQPGEIGSIYLGGGNPGLLTDRELIRLVQGVAQAWQVLPGTEWTVEMRPESVTRERLDLLRGLGITRVSVGIQSLCAAEREALGRGGTDAEVRAALTTLAAHWDNWNLDLIYGIPRQTLASWEETLAAAERYRPPHLSLYDLTLGEGTLLARRVDEGSVQLPSEDETVLMLQHAQERLAASGYEQYEVSNWSLPGYTCRHNLNYWQGGDYLGAGPGAVSTWQGKRWRRTQDLATYLATDGEAREDEEELDAATRRREALLLGLRLSAGIDRTRFSREHGSDPVQQAAAAVARWQAAGALAYDEARLWVTAQGMRWNAAIIADLLD